jgi:myo-inositol-1(or 4)-monophosphatase
LIPQKKDPSMPSRAPWTELTDFALGLSQAAAAEILPHFRQNTPIDVKPHETWDPVTEGDRAGERAIRHLIEKNYPSHGIIGEEYGTKKGSSAFTWVLDPIDGTRAFVIGLPTWAILIGLYEDGEPKLGVMCQPFVGDTFFGNPHGAWLEHRGDRQQIHVRAEKPLAHASVGTTSPHLYKGADKTGFERLSASVQSVRYGGDAYFFSLMAAGHMDIAMDPTLQIYDIAALIPIIRGAGGVVGTWSGAGPEKGGNILAASSQNLFDQARAKITDQSSR